MDNKCDLPIGVKMKKFYYLFLCPLGKIRRYFLEMASFGQVLVPPSKTWIFQRDFFLKSLNATIAIDVGGNLGQWAIEARKVSKARIITFEPDPRCYTELLEHSYLDANWEVFQKAAGMLNSEELLTLMNVEHGYSSLKNVTAFGLNFSKEDVEEINTARVRVERLDSHFDSATLRNEVVWLIEISMLDLYENTPKVSTIIKFLEDRDFVLCSTFSERWTNTGVADFDALFIKSSLVKEIIY